MKEQKRKEKYSKKKKISIISPGLLVLKGLVLKIPSKHKNASDLVIWWQITDVTSAKGNKTGYAKKDKIDFIQLLQNERKTSL